MHRGRVALFLWISQENLYKIDPININKKLLPWAPKTGVNPSIQESANIVPEISHGNPVNKYDLSSSIIVHEAGRENKDKDDEQ